MNKLLKQKAKPKIKHLSIPIDLYEKRFSYRIRRQLKDQGYGVRVYHDEMRKSIVTIHNKLAKELGLKLDSDR